MTARPKNRPALDLSGSFLHLLCKWKGSLYKLCYKEVFCFLVPFYIALTGDQRSTFEKLAHYCDKYLNMIPLSFILGFYVTIIATRWWQQLLTLPWPDRLMMCITMFIPGNDPHMCQLRKTLVRNVNLMAVLVLRSISDSVRNRLKTLEDIVQAGFMTQAELECYKAAETDINIFWLPAFWFVHRLYDAESRGLIPNQQGVKKIIGELLDFRSRCGTLWCYNWVSIPLVYTQVVTMSTYTFFIACIFGRQYIEDGKGLPIDRYFPIWTVLQLLFYMGLLKVAEHMLDPYGDDDEDFDLNFLLNRNHRAIELGTVVFTSDKLPKMADETSSCQNPVTINLDSNNQQIDYGNTYAKCNNISLADELPPGTTVTSVAKPEDDVYVPLENDFLAGQFQLSSLADELPPDTSATCVAKPEDDVYVPLESAFLAGQFHLSSDELFVEQTEHNDNSLTENNPPNYYMEANSDYEVTKI